MAKYTGAVGLIAIVLAAFLFSTKRSAIQKRVVIWGIVLQVAFAFLVLKTPIAKAFYAVSLFVNEVLNYSSAGESFVFGEKLGVKNDQFGVIVAFQVLPIVIFICSVFAILYYLGVMQVCVKGMAVFMQRFMGTSGAESTCVAASPTPGAAYMVSAMSRTSLWMSGVNAVTGVATFLRRGSGYSSMRSCAMDHV